MHTETALQERTWYEENCWLTASTCCTFGICCTVPTETTLFPDCSYPMNQHSGGTLELGYCCLTRDLSDGSLCSGVPPIHSSFSPLSFHRSQTSPTAHSFTLSCSLSPLSFTDISLNTSGAHSMSSSMLEFTS